jgi:diguanylate cyclase (GGDEF)-like protein/PAS domain S-box-containing protein
VRIWPASGDAGAESTAPGQPAGAGQDGVATVRGGAIPEEADLEQTVPGKPLVGRQESVATVAGTAIPQDADAATIAPGAPPGTAGEPPTVRPSDAPQPAATMALRSTDFARAFVMSSDCMIVTDLDARITAANQATVDLYYGTAPPRDVRGSVLFDLLAPEDAAAARAARDEAMRVGVSPLRDYRVRRHDGSFVTVEASVGALVEESGELRGLLVVYRDVTDRRRLEEALRHERDLLRASEEKFAKAFRLSPEVMSITTLDDGRFLEVNDAFCKVLGYSRQEAVGCTGIELELYVDPRRRDEIVAGLRQAGCVAELEVDLRDKHGDVHTTLLSAELIEIGGRRCILTALRDITERKRLETELERLAHHDALTGLPNRVLIEDRLEQVLALARRHDRAVAVMMVDLDRFKDVNDTFGHRIGDQVLVAAARHLESCLRKSDSVGRMGGDEFVIVLGEVQDFRGAARVAQRILAAFAKPFHVEGHEVRSGLSIGISVRPVDGDDVEALLKHADAAMYRAKAASGSTFQFFEPGMAAAAAERAVLETSLRHAIDRRELALHYQPQVALGSGNIIGVEALIRWKHPERGMVNPGQFIPLAEETGLIVPLGEWVLREACVQARSWRDSGLPPFRVAVNLSARQLRQRDLVEMIASVLHETGFSPTRLELEVTETGAMEDPERAVATLRRIRELGVRVALDDFGVGHCSLAYLRRFPIDTLKIGQPFTQEAPANEQHAAMLTAMVEMGRTVGVRTVVAECVETREQLDLVRRIRCDVAQGYLLSRPAPARDLDGVLRRGRIDH